MTNVSKLYQIVLPCDVIAYIEVSFTSGNWSRSTTRITKQPPNRVFYGNGMLMQMSINATKQFWSFEAHLINENVANML